MLRVSQDLQFRRGISQFRASFFCFNCPFGTAGQNKNKCFMENLLRFGRLFLSVLTLIGITSCENDVEDAITVRMRNSANGNTYLYMPATNNNVKLRIDGSNNFWMDESDERVVEDDEVHYLWWYAEICSVGKVGDLSDIDRIPNDNAGWTSKMAVQPGRGYVVRARRKNADLSYTSYKYMRLRVDSWIDGTNNGILGAVVTYQGPFVP